MTLRAISRLTNPMTRRTAKTEKHRYVILVLDKDGKVIDRGDVTAPFTHEQILLALRDWTVAIAEDEKQGLETYAYGVRAERVD